MKTSIFISLLIFTTFTLFSLNVSSQTVNSGDSVSGTLTPNDIDTHTFTASSGDSIHLKANSSMQTYLSVYNPSGSLINNSYNAFYQLNVAETGTYSIKIKPRYAGQQGSYTLHYANGTTANEHGSLTSGNSHTNTLDSQDLDSYIFTATRGDGIHLSVDSAMQTYMSIYNPDGSLLSQNYNAFTNVSAPQNGDYHVIIHTRYAFQSGDYTIHYANGSTANELGTLLSGDSTDGTLTSQDLNSYILNATRGDGIHISVDSSMQTYMTIYNPDGSLLSQSYNTYVNANVPQNGNYRIIIQTRYGFQSGDYTLHYVNGSTANELGLLSSGGLHTESLSSQDLDTFTYTATRGDGIHLSVDSSMQTYLSIYNPDGSLLGHAYNTYVNVKTPQTGTYRVVIKPRYAFQSGAYTLHYVNSSTANELGALVDGQTSSGSLTSQDLNSYTFSASRGNSISLTSSSSMQTYLTIYNPDGSLLGNGYNAYTNALVQQTGTYRVIIQTRYGFQSGSYTLDYVEN